MLGMVKGLAIVQHQNRIYVDSNVLGWTPFAFVVGRLQCKLKNMCSKKIIMELEAHRNMGP